MQRRRGCLAQHGENQLDVGHVVAQVLPFQRLHLFVLVDFEAKGLA
jgi:hypothetical protein